MKLDQTWHPKGPCLLFACDIASFGAEARTDPIQKHVRDALYSLVRTSFEESGVDLSRSYQEDRGDGLFIALPLDVGVEPVVSAVPDRLRAELVHYNEKSSEAAQIRLRVSVHLGEAHRDAHGLVGTAVNHMFRLLEAPPLREALSASEAELATVVSDRVFQDFVRHGTGRIVPGDYQRAEIIVKETTTVGWIRIPGLSPALRATQAEVQEYGARPNSHVRPAAPGAEALFDLVDALQAIPMLAGPAGRDQLIGALSQGMAGVIPRHAEARLDLYAIVRTCLDYPGGLQELRSQLRGFVGDSMLLDAVDQGIARLLLGT